MLLLVVVVVQYWCTSVLVSKSDTIANQNELLLLHKHVEWAASVFGHASTGAVSWFLSIDLARWKTPSVKKVVCLKGAFLKRVH